MPEDVQPDAGQGAEATGTPTALESYLQSVPENLREQVTPYLKDAEKNVNTRLQEAAEFRKTWEPYQELSGVLQQYKPQDLQQLLAWHQQIASSEDAYREWLAEQAREAGLTPAEAAQLQAEEEAGELTRDEIQKLIEQSSQQQLAPLQERLAEYETERAVDAEAETIRTELGRLEEENGVQLSDEQKAMVIDLGLGHEGDDWVQAGFGRFKALTAEAQKAFVEDKTGQPRPPLNAGGQAKAELPKTFEEARLMAGERLRQQQS